MNGLAKVDLAFVPEDLEASFAVYVCQTLGPARDRFGLEAARVAAVTAAAGLDAGSRPEQVAAGDLRRLAAVLKREGIV